MSKICQKCGNILEDNDTFCLKCGQTVEDNQNKLSTNKNILIIAIAVGLALIITIIGLVVLVLNNDDSDDNNRNNKYSDNDDDFDLLGNYISEFDDKEFVCPDFVGMTIEEVEKNKAFSLLDIDFQYVENDEYETNVICNQSIPRDKKIKTGAKITLYISRGAQNIKVPNDIYGELEEYAVTKLKALGFVTVVKYISHDEIEEGYVIKTDPARSTVVPEGTEVTIYVSSGSAIKLIEVPHVVGLKKEKAKEIIEKAGLIPEFEDRDLTAAEKDFKKGYVVAQDPDSESNEMVTEGSTIKVYVSTGVVNYTYSPMAPIRDDFDSYEKTGYVSIWDEDGNKIEESLEIDFNGKGIYYFDELITNELEVKYIAKVRFGTDSTWYDYAIITIDVENDSIVGDRLIYDYQDYKQ